MQGTNIKLPYYIGSSAALNPATKINVNVAIKIEIVNIHEFAVFVIYKKSLQS